MSCSPAKPPATLKEMWVENMAWAEKNFPGRTLLDVLKHVQEEVNEVAAARLAFSARSLDHRGRQTEDTRQAKDQAREELLSECADVMILTAQMMLMLDADPETEQLRKWAEVRERTYKDGKKTTEAGEVGS